MPATESHADRADARTKRAAQSANLFAPPSAMPKPVSRLPEYTEASTPPHTRALEPVTIEWLREDVAHAQERALRHIGKHGVNAEGTLYQACGDPELDNAARMRQVLFTRAVDVPLSPFETGMLIDTSKAAMPKLGTPQYTALVKKVFGDVFRRDTVSLDETTSERIRAGWRIVREMARSKRLISLDEPLITAIFHRTPSSLDMWTMPTETTELPSTFEYLSKPDTTANPLYLQYCADSLRLRKEYWPWTLAQLITTEPKPDDMDDDFDPYEANDDTDPDFFDPAAPNRFIQAAEPFVIRAGLPLLPPPVPLKFHDAQGQINAAYKTPNDPNLQLYIRSVDATADWLGIYNGSELEPEAGRRGMMGMINANTVRIAFPTRMQLVAWEYILINETLEMMTKKGGRNTYSHLIKKYGFNHTEVNGMIRMTKRFARDLVNADRAEDRALMLLRCEDMMERAREACDLKSEQNAMKQMSMILGLTRTEEDETLNDFVQIVKETTNRRIASNAALRIAGPKDDPRFDLSSE